MGAIPRPDDPLLSAACDQIGFLASDTIGLTLGYGIYLVAGHRLDLRLIAHELRHVAQYEECASIPAFLDRYLREILEFGYENAPLEVDARGAESGYPTLE